MFCNNCDKLSMSIDGKNYGNCKTCGSILFIKKIESKSVESQKNTIVENTNKVPSNNIISEKITL